MTEPAGYVANRVVLFSGSTSENAAAWMARREYLHIQFGSGWGLQKLKEIASAHPENSDVLESLARAQEHFRAFDLAARTYESAAQNASCSARLRLLGLAAIAHSKNGEKEAALGVIERMRRLACNLQDGELILLSALSDVNEKHGEPQLQIAVLERMIELTPDDTSLMFELAFAHSSAGNNDLSMFHYLKIPENDRDDATWNNIGVSYDRASLPAKGMNAYEKSEQNGGTRATSNLAESLIKAGFLEDAERRCRTAMTRGSVDENVGLTLARVKTVMEQEEIKEQEILTSAKRKSDFYRAVGRAASAISSSEMAGIWRSQDRLLIVSIRGDRFTAIGSYEQLPNALALFSAGIGPGIQPQTVKIREEYTGVIRGRSIEGYVMRTREGDAPTTLLSSLDKGTDVLLALNDDGSEFAVMENPTSTAPRFYSMARLTTN